MQPVLDFLLRYGYWVLFLNVLSEQLAVPIPAGPVLLAMGALAGLGKFSLSLSLLLAVVACLICDQVWYRLGGIRGHSILRLICKISLEPDSCVSSTKTTFAKWGAWSLLVAKFVPGLSAVAAPLAGLTRMPLWKFLLADSGGSILWTGAYLATGYVFRNQLEDVALATARFGGWILTGAILAVAGYIGYKFYQRRRFLHGLRVSRISPEELRDLLAAGDDVAVIDLRHELELYSDSVRIPGAMWIPTDKIESHRDEIPHDKEIVLYCS